MNNKQPNIILINCDDLGYGDLGCYGSDLHSTPHLDRMAEEGIRFTDFYMASPVCSPSRAAMMTGCYPQRIGFGEPGGKIVLFPGDAFGLHPEERTMACMLKDKGYATQLVGKWHCGDQEEFLPTKFGFDHYYGLPYSNDMGVQAKNKRQEQTIQHKVCPLPLIRDEEVIQEQPDQAALTERYVEEAVRFIRNSHKKFPFFLYFAHMYVHVPVYAPEKFLRESKNGTYGAGVAGIDWTAGVLMDELKRLGIDDDTIIIFTSDNGSNVWAGGSNGALRGRKGQVWEGGMRVPCIIRWPGKIESGRTSDTLCSSIDFMPTLAKITGAEMTTERITDGVDLSQELFSGERSVRDSFFYYFRNHLCAVRDSRWKLMVAKQLPENPFDIGVETCCELYDLKNDIGETNNVANENPEIVTMLMKKIEACRIDLGDTHLGIEGKNCRPIGEVETPKTLTTYDPNHPYIIAEYDICDRG